jgi:hypothetical protein
VWLFWLPEGQWYGGVDELEGVALVGGGLGEHGHGGVGVGEADLVAGEGGQVLEQAAEAAVGVAERVVLALALAWAWVERWAGATGLVRWGGCSSVKVSGAQAWRRCQSR